MDVNIKKEHEGYIQLHSVYVSEIVFRRTAVQSDKELTLKIKPSINPNIEENTTDVTLDLKLNTVNSDELEIQLSLTGVFSAQEDLNEEEKEKAFKINAVSILFPYLRTQVSLITTQPGFEPINLPVMNIHEFLKSKNEIV